VFYLIQTYGPEQMVALLADHGAGRSTDDAMASRLGVDMARFESDWWMWLGVPRVWRGTPAPWPTPAAGAVPTQAAVRPGAAPPPPAPGGKTGAMALVVTGALLLPAALAWLTGRGRGRSARP
jgi:hypothetical protein